MKDTHSKEQYQQTIADTHKAVADGLDDAPDRAALKGGRRLSYERPYLCQLVIPGGQSIFQSAYDPVIADRLSPPKQMRPNLGRIYRTGLL